jgi:hypothetical protein
VIASGLPWLLSFLTITAMALAGEKKREAWAVGLVNQLLWLSWIVVMGAWGLLPMNIALWIVYGRNWKRWSEA